MKRAGALAWLCLGLSYTAFAAPSDPPADSRIDIKVDPAPCNGAVASLNDAAIIAVCDALIDNDRTERADRLKALLARGAAYQRQEDTDRAIADYDVALRLNPKLADIFNTRGELHRSKGDRPRALADFGAALKLNPQHAAARGNFKALALELEKIGADMGIKGRPKPPLK
ncbi:tetratricopeptide repeat protein [Tardiphaga sp.]|uniref:tetratricopeptide repeat protein n=1 Tax=Tardiphaga sp. TaxID=1926292 RepID=UPI00261EA2CF|nr:tetratricopeptide repeat protein [Tardiphaga sp.]